LRCTYGDGVPLAYWSWAPATSLTKSVSGGVDEFRSVTGLTWFGWVGVEVFFVISGFVISHSASGASPVAFLRGRIVRLYPSAWVSATLTLITVILLGRGSPGTAMEYLRAMTLWVQGPWIDGVYWTLGIEVIFYSVIFGALCLGRFCPLPLVISVLAANSGIFWFVLALDRLFPATLPVPFVHDLLASPSSAFLLLRHGCFFSLGGLLWLCHSERITPWRIVLLGLCLASGVFEIMDSARDIVLPIGDSLQRRILPCAVWLAAVLCLEVAIYYNRALQHWFGRAVPLLKFFGLMTYPLYLLHDVIGAAMLKTVSTLGASPVIALVAATSVVVVLSGIVTRWLEPPLQSMLRNFLSRSVSQGIQTRLGRSMKPNPN
jgi:peptidoglycan/LPS O-acetylase OafA/YrhL